jgi:uncharacterized protein (TIGR00725 family)
MRNNHKQIAVIGGRTPSEAELKLAEEVGRLVAEGGYQLICGGMGGVMEAACKGASEADGVTIGVLPGSHREEANQYVKIAIATGIGIARNSILAHSADAAVAIAGRYGTLSEVAYFLQLGKPVAILSCPWKIPGAIEVSSAEEAMKAIGAD